MADPHALGLDTDTLDAVLDSIREFRAQRLSDEVLLELDREDRFPLELVREMCGEGLGVHLLFIPEAYGGMGGNSFDVYRVCELMGSIDLGVATGVLATFLGSDPILFGGTPAQQERWLGRIAEEGLLMAYGATEPQAGSDLGALRTVASPVHEAGELVGYRHTGAKQWISNGGSADLYTILALAPGGPSWFVMERDVEGFTAGKAEDKHGIRASNTASLSLDEVFVAKDRLIGDVEGQGLVQAQNVFGYTRLMVAAFGLGAGWAALERAIAYSVERKQGGAPLSERQGYTHKLIVPHAVRLEAGRAYIEETARRIDAGEGALNTEGAIAKYLSTEAGNGAAEAAIQALGGYGYTREYMVEKIKRELMERARQRRLTRNQHVLFRFGELAASAESAGALSRRAAAARRGDLPGKTDQRFGSDALAAFGRAFAREAAQKVAQEGLRWVSGAGGVSAEEMNSFEQSLKLGDVYRAQAGLLADLDHIADVLYDRVG